MQLEIPRAAEDSNISLFVLTPEHVSEAYVSWLNSPEINKYLESRFATHTVESTKAFVATMLASPANLFLGIRSHELSRHIGNIKLGPVDLHHETADIGILIGDKETWGKGVATSAITMLAGIAERQLKLRKLTAGCYASNGGSRRAFEKAGFVVEGMRPSQFLLHGVPEDIVLMGRILK